MIRSTHTPAEHTPPPAAAFSNCVWRCKRLFLARPRLISNLLALVALFSIGFV